MEVQRIFSSGPATGPAMGSVMVTTGAAGAIALAAYACVAGDDSKKIRQLPDTTGMKSELIVQKLHRNVYDHAARTAGLKVVEVEGREQLASAINPNTAKGATLQLRAPAGPVSAPPGTSPRNQPMNVPPLTWIVCPVM